MLVVAVRGIDSARTSIGVVLYPSRFGGTIVRGPTFIVLALVLALVLVWLVLSSSILR